MMATASAGVKVMAMVVLQCSQTTAQPTLKGTANR
jgi:hypothetical protein